METTELTFTDRCDSCGSAAYVRWLKKPDLILDMCGHHSNRYSSALQGKGWEILVDDRAKLTESVVGAEVA